MTPAEVKDMVHAEIERMFGGGENVVFSHAGKRSEEPPGRLFYERFLEVMTSVHTTLKEVAQRVATVEHRLYDLEQMMRHRGEVPVGRAEGNRS